METSPLSRSPGNPIYRVLLGAVIFAALCACPRVEQTESLPITNTAPPQTAGNEEPTEWVVHNNGQPIHARSRGTGANILMVINGGPGQSHHYCESADALVTPELRVVTFDQRGTGNSPHPVDADYSMDAYVGDLEALRIDLGIERIHLLGHSFGGSYAIAYTAAHPHRVASLQLFASSPVTTQDSDSSEFERRIATYERNGTFPEGYDDFRENTDCAFYFQTIWPVYLYDATFPITDSLRATTCDVETFMGTSNSNPRGWDFRNEVKDYTGPVAVYYGEADPFISETKSIAKYFESTDPVEHQLPNCGHYWEECADDLMPRLAHFLSEAMSP